MSFDALRQWSRRSLANSFALRAASGTLLSVLLVAGVSILILMWTERRAIEATLHHDAQTARTRVEEPLKIVASELAQLAKSPMFATALLDSGGRATYARPFLENYHFPLAAANGLALCDLNGQLLAGSKTLAECSAEQPEFAQVLADGKSRQVWRIGNGRQQWLIYQGVTFAYTGTTEGLLVARVDLDELLRTLPDELNLASVTLGASGGNTGMPTDALRVPLFKGEAVGAAGPLELLVIAQPRSVWTKLLPLLAAYLLATLVLVVAIVLRARRNSRALIEPLAALRDRACEIAVTKNLSLPIPSAGTDEVGHLADSFAGMVTALRNADDQRRESEARFQLIFEKSDEAILFAWPDGRIEAVNPAACRLFGYSEAEFRLLGRAGVMDTSDHRLPAALEERARTGTFRGELRCRHADGHTFPIEVVSTLFLDALGTARTSNLFRDISERVAAERERDENNRRMAMLSHKLVAVQESTRRRLAQELHERTSPNLAAIAINLESASLVLRERDWKLVGERMADNRGLLEDTAFGIREVCADLRPPALDYAGLVAAVEAYVGQFARRTGIPVAFEHAPGAPRPSAEIESMLFRIVQEALTNVAKHAQATRASVSLAIDNAMIVLTVSDDGRGFAPDQLAGDAGLGLISMREMAEFLGGAFDIQSSSGGGTRVRASIPA